MRLVPSDLAWGKPAMNDTQKSAQSTTGKASRGFTDEERSAMRQRARELKAAARRGPRAGDADGESDVLAKIAEMPVRDARVRQGRQYRLPLPERAEVQDEVRDLGLQRQGEP